MSRRIFACLPFFLAPASLFGAAQLQQALMTKVKPANDCSTPAATTTFYTTDPVAYLWFSISGMNAGDVAATAYYTPSGQLYSAPSGSFDPVDSAGGWCFTDTAFQIQGAFPATQPGTWKVYISNNGVVLGTVTFTISSPCTYTLSPASATAAASGGSGSFSVSVGSGCAWTAASSAAWLTTTSTGTGSGTVNYSVAANTATTSRSGTITVGGQTFTLTQAGASAAPTGNTTEVDLSSWANTDTRGYAGSPAYPTGETTFLSVRFNIPNTSAGYNAWRGTGSGLSTLSLPVNVSGATSVYFILNSIWGVAGNTSDPSSSKASITFTGTGGNSYTKNLYGNIDIRDYNSASYTNSINGTTTQNVWTQGGQRLDVMRVDLPAGFASQTLTGITLNDTGGESYQRLLLKGVTVISGGGSTNSGLNLNINQVITTTCPSNQVIVSVTDSQGNPVTGLTASNFTLKEGGQVRNITVTPVGTGSSGALSLAIVIDVSGSLSGTGLTNEKAAAKQLISQLGASDAAAIWQFTDGVTLLQDFTSDKAKLNAAVDAANGDGSTALYDAIQKAAQSLGARSGRKAMVLMTDGADNNSSAKLDTAIAAAKTAGVPVFAVGFGSANQTILTQISTQTGGFYSAAATSADLQRILGSIGQVISSQYQITYTSGAPSTDNTIDITVTSGSLTATASRSVPKCSGGGSGSCNYFVQPLSQTIPASGGTGIIVQVFTAQGCTWTAFSNASWITIIGGATGNGNGAVSYSIPANTSASSRVGTVTIAGQTHTVTQLGGSGTCNYTVSPTVWSLTSAGGVVTILVATDATCSWTAASNTSWIALSTQGAGTGAGRAYFNAQANSSTSARSGTLTVAGQTVNVSQLAGGTPCGYTVGPTSWNLPAAAATGAVILTTGSNCAWTASSAASWITIASAASGTGTSTISFSAQANTAASPRTGILNVAGHGVTLIQAAAPPPTNPNTPSISDGGVVNAASNRPGTLARGSFFTLYGVNLGPAQPSQATTYPIPDTMGGIVVTVTQGSVTKRAFLHFVSATQINAIMPSDAPLGDVQITVNFGGTTSAAATATVVDSNFGAFSVAGGSGPGILQNYQSAATQPLNMPSMPAKPGQIVILWGTGLGAIAQPDNQPPSGGSLNIPVTVEVGGKSANILYSGRAPSFAAVDNIYFEVPADAPLGCSVPLRVKAGNAYANTVRMAISAGGEPCQDTVNPFAGMTANGAMSGSIMLVRASLAGQLQYSQPAVDVTFDAGLVMFTQTSAGGVLGFSAALDLPPIGACTSNTRGLDFTSLLGGNLYSVDPSVQRELDAGAELRITGPNGSSTFRHLNSSSNTGPYLAVLGGTVPVSGSPAMPPFLEPGTFTVTGSGGKDIGAFTATLQMPPMLTWTNRSSIDVVDRTVPLSITWSGGDPGSTVVIGGVVSDSKSKTAGGFACLASASAGQFSVPASALADLPATRPMSGTDDTLGAITVGVLPLANLPRFTAPGLSAGYGIMGSVNVKMVQVK